MAQVRHEGDKKRQLSPLSVDGLEKIIFSFSQLNKINRFGIENAINQCKV
jgi:hypothetical protein